MVDPISAGVTAFLGAFCGYAAGCARTPLQGTEVISHRCVCEFQQPEPAAQCPLPLPETFGIHFWVPVCVSLFLLGIGIGFCGALNCCTERGAPPSPGKGSGKGAWGGAHGTLASVGY